MTDAIDHPQRFALVAELHARPSPRLQAPVTAVFLAFKEPREASLRDRSRDIAHLGALTRRHGAPAPEPGAGHYVARLGRHDLRWESHAEFITYTAFAPGLPQRPFDPALAEIFPADWQAAAPGKRLSAAIVHVEQLPDDPATLPGRLPEWFSVDGLAVVWVLEESAVVASDFRIDPAGFMRFAVFVRPGTGPGRTGRIVQRLLELETYRAMSMLGLPRARDMAERLNALEPRLGAIVDGMGAGAGGAGRPAEAVLDDLLTAAAELEAAAAQIGFRLSATRAYSAIVAERVAALREARFMGRQTLSEFMARRYAPAMRTVASAETRLQAMLDRTERAGELLRTRVDVTRSGQNRDLLARMDRRADLQLRLQNTVEGLSVVAISYYAVGLAGYLLGPLAARTGTDKGLLSAALVPVIVLVVWLGMRRVRRRLHPGGGDL